MLHSYPCYSSLQHYAMYTQAAIVGINVFYFVRIQFMSRDGYTAPGTTGPSGYTSFPGDTDQPPADDDEDEHRKQYAPPEYWFSKHLTVIYFLTVLYMYSYVYDSLILLLWIKILFIVCTFKSLLVHVHVHDTVVLLLCATSVSSLSMNNYNFWQLWRRPLPTACSWAESISRSSQDHVGLSEESNSPVSRYLFALCWSVQEGYRSCVSL